MGCALVQREDFDVGITGAFTKGRVAAALACVVFLSATAAAASNNTTLTGTAVWTTQSSPELGLESTTTTIHGTFSGKLGRGTYSGTFEGGSPFTTGDCGPVCENVTGTITFSSTRGDFTTAVEPGSVVALEDIASHSFRTFTLMLDVESGTRSYAHADGTLTLLYSSVWSHFFDSETLQFINRIDDSGTLTGNPR
jgi:hypothetical protein